MAKRSKFLIVLYLGLAIGIGASAYAVWTTFYDHIMAMSEVRRINVEEMSGTNPLQLKITVDNLDNATVIRTVTTKRRGHSVIVLYHLAISGLVKPSLNWHEPYPLTVPYSVSDVRFGRNAEVIWQRSKIHRIDFSAPSFH